MAERPDNLIEALIQSITENHACTAFYQQSVWVEEKMGNQIWTGQVETFELRGHPDAHHAYGWWEETYQKGLVVILALNEDTNAAKAIRAYLMSQDSSG